MRKLIVGLMLLFFSVNVFAWDVSENYYVKDSRGTSHRLATSPQKTYSATNAREAANKAGILSAVFALGLGSCAIVSFIICGVQWFLADDEPIRNSDGSVKNYAGKWAVYAVSFLAYTAVSALSWIICRKYEKEKNG
ncbi:MAG: hypothetical protein Ta2C_04800 [Candidatus Endomicrobiellum trichonymphae]|uniref:hypothetical protein n=1 Tax=Endomicrobium trichonymphae TaxID=1408204 RepID=UPI0027D405BC|nr:MAG: hypothetical protein Ta2C_04800 [Candidatus Endomicrobium trichonymphae]